MMIGVAIACASEDRVGGGHDVVDVWHECRFEDVRLGRDAVTSPDAHNGSVQIIERASLDLRGDFAGEAADAYCRAGNNAAAGLLHRLDDCIHVERNQAAK